MRRTLRGHTRGRIFRRLLLAALILAAVALVLVLALWPPCACGLSIPDWPTGAPGPSVVVMRLPAWPFARDCARWRRGSGTLDRTAAEAGSAARMQPVAEAALRAKKPRLTPVRLDLAAQPPDQMAQFIGRVQRFLIPDRRQ